MDNGLLNDLFSFVDRFRQNEKILTTLALPECEIFVGVSQGDNLLTAEQTAFIKQELITRVQAEQNSTWGKMASILDVGSPYQ